ncbi:DEAD/DEAH box helicase [soil metagenome]
MTLTDAAPRCAPRPRALIGLEAILRSLSDRTGDGLVHVERLEARPARIAPLATPLPPALWERLGVDALWNHQAEAIDLARAGRSVAVATGTASGKSLCYQVPIGEAVATPVRPGTALALFPTKALAQDQLRAISALGFPGLQAVTYDGDSSPEERTWARGHANTVLTNPDMLHCGILPHHERWATFLMRLRYVVVDELHTFRGIFGSHVAHLLRRLRRLCAHYGSAPTFIFCSATIGEPARLASALCGLDVTAVTNDGSPLGDRLFALWSRPPIASGTGAGPTGARPVSLHRQSAELAAELIAAGHRTITFCRSRKGTEVVAADVRRRLPADLADAVRPYRGGYLASERRAVEAELFDGSLRGVVATTALELGVDIGGLDACVLAGYPGTIASLWQQAGRAGRERQASVAVLVAGDDQLDQWLMAHPHEVFTRPPEPAVVNPANPDILLPHLACAAFERPLGHQDEAFWPGLLDEGVRRLVLADRLKVRAQVHGRRRWREPRAVWAGRGYPSHGVGLRSGSAVEYRIATDDGTLVGTVDASRAFESVHPGARYLHQGRAWKVRALDLDDHVAFVEPADYDERTAARSETDLTVLDVDAQRRVGRARLALGSVEVVSRVTGYQRTDGLTGASLGRVDLDLPATRLVTRGFWYVIDDEVLVSASVAPPAVPGSLHAAEHTAIGVLPLFTICDRWDVGGVSTVRLAGADGPAIVIYDGYPGGAGIAELGYEAGDRHLQAALDVIASCRCVAGCPSCVQSPKCGNGNEPLDKGGATRLLRTVLVG